MILIIQISQCFVSLRFPKARQFKTNILVNKVQGLDCESEADKATALKAGELVNISWWLDFPYTEGFKLELVTNHSVIQLKPLNNMKLKKGNSVTVEVELPKNPCAHCFIRLEYILANQSIKSCADVALLTQADYKEDCSGHGNVNDQSDCICERLYYGDKCQFMKECISNEDCNGPKGQGECVHLEEDPFKR